MPETYETFEEKPYATQYLVAEALIDHPVAVVWPRIVDIASWMTAHELETISGASGSEGHLERVRPRTPTEGIEPPHYHLYGIAKVVPFRCLVLEVFPEQGGSYGNAFYPPEYLGIDTILLTD